LTNHLAGRATGTAEYCDKYANALNRCIPGNWPSHAWTVAFAPYENPEIAVVAYVYNGTEGATVAGPIVRRVLEAYFELKNIDSGAVPAP
jgi:penicillin-binding protein 2